MIVEKAHPDALKKQLTFPEGIAANTRSNSFPTVNINDWGPLNSLNGRHGSKAGESFPNSHLDQN